jgi:hypothetical protein
MESVATAWRFFQMKATHNRAWQLSQESVSNSVLSNFARSFLQTEVMKHLQLFWSSREVVRRSLFDFLSDRTCG